MRALDLNSGLWGTGVASCGRSPFQGGCPASKVNGMGLCPRKPRPPPGSHQFDPIAAARSAKHRVAASGGANVGDAENQPIWPQHQGNHEMKNPACTDTSPNTKQLGSRSGQNLVIAQGFPLVDIKLIDRVSPRKTCFSISMDDLVSQLRAVRTSIFTLERVVRDDWISRRGATNCGCLPPQLNSQCTRWACRFDEP